MEKIRKDHAVIGLTLLVVVATIAVVFTAGTPRRVGVSRLIPSTLRAETVKSGKDGSQ